MDGMVTAAVDDDGIPASGTWAELRARIGAEANASPMDWADTGGTSPWKGLVTAFKRSVWPCMGEDARTEHAVELQRKALAEARADMRECAAMGSARPGEVYVVSESRREAIACVDHRTARMAALRALDARSMHQARDAAAEARARGLVLAWDGTRTISVSEDGRRIVTLSVCRPVTPGAAIPDDAGHDPGWT